LAINRFSKAAWAAYFLAQLALGITPAYAQSESDDAALTRTITALDAKVFDAYNSCDLKAFGSYFSPTVEFYHDKGGVTYDRETVVMNTRKYICDKVRRELVQGSLKVYPVKDYGAIEEGEHIFCEIKTGACEGAAKFLMIWQNTDGKWLMTRVISYGHRALLPAEKEALKLQSHP